MHAVHALERAPIDFGAAQFAKLGEFQWQLWPPSRCSLHQFNPVDVNSFLRPDQLSGVRVGSITVMCEARGSLKYEILGRERPKPKKLKALLDFRNAARG